MRMLRTGYRIVLIVFLFLGFALAVATEASAPDHAGELDPSFASGGVLALDLASSWPGPTVLVQRDGRVVVTGERHAWQNEDFSDFALARALVNGAPDPTFGEGGFVTTDIAGLPNFLHASILQDDHKVVAAGSTRVEVYNENFTLVRYLPDGALDPLFGDKGNVLTDMGASEQVRAIAIQPDMKIIAAGIQSYRDEGGNALAMARYLPDGARDPDFGQGGKVVMDFGNGASASAIVVLPDHRIVVAGGTSGPYGSDIFVARYEEDGTLDSTFGEGGSLGTDLSGFVDRADSLILQNDGTIVVAGTSGSLPDTDFVLLRYNHNGTLDTSFGDGGVVITDVSGSDDMATAVRQQADGKLLAGGFASPDYENRDFAVARYTADGILDPAFGTGGIVLTDFGEGTITDSATATGMDLYPDGRIVLAGRSGADTLLMARYLNDSSWLVPRLWFPALQR